MAARQVVLLTSPNSFHLPQLLSRQQSVPVTVFGINTYSIPTSVHSRELTERLSPLDATLTRNRGEGCLRSYQYTGTLPRLIPFVCHSYENCRGGILPNLELASHHSFGSSLRLDLPQFSASGAAACGDSFFSPEPFDFQLSTLNLFCLGSSRVTEHGAHFPKGSRRRLKQGGAKLGWRRRPSTRNRAPARKIGDAKAMDHARATLRDDRVWRIPCAGPARIADKPRPTLPCASPDAFSRGWRPQRWKRSVRLP